MGSESRYDSITDTQVRLSTSVSGSGVGQSLLVGRLCTGRATYQCCPCPDSVKNGKTSKTRYPPLTGCSVVPYKRFGFESRRWTLRGTSSCLPIRSPPSFPFLSSISHQGIGSNKVCCRTGVCPGPCQRQKW